MPNNIPDQEDILATNERLTAGNQRLSLGVVSWPAVLQVFVTLPTMCSGNSCGMAVI